MVITMDLLFLIEGLSIMSAVSLRLTRAPWEKDQKGPRGYRSEQWQDLTSAARFGSHIFFVDILSTQCALWTRCLFFLDQRPIRARARYFSPSRLGPDVTSLYVCILYGQTDVKLSPIARCSVRIKYFYLTLLIRNYLRIQLQYDIGRSMTGEIIYICTPITETLYVFCSHE